ncbi:MAG: purine-binding chemotaxis protein CheW [Desulfobacteraceae bacterium]|nr:purine-binding chemotaxis protein CheW [Desulfobacteraceae bacterium]
MALYQNSDDILQLIGFYAGGKLYGSEILTVREILRSPKIEPVDDGPSFAMGFLQLRGIMMPVIDLACYIGNTLQENKRPWVLITSSGGKITGYQVESVTQILRVDRGAIKPAPKLLTTGMKSQFMRGVCDTDKGLLILLDFEKMLASSELNDIAESTHG